MNFVDRLKSWPMWEGIAAIVVFLVLQFTGTDISGIVLTLMGLLLVVLVGFGIINDPATHEKMFANGEQYWYQSKVMWLGLAALITYCVQLFFHLDAGPFINGLLDVLLPVLMTLGIVKSPTSASTL